MKRIYQFSTLNIFVLYCAFPLLINGQESGNDDTREPYATLYVERDKYEYMMSLPDLNYPEGLFRRVHWINLEYRHKKKKESDDPLIITNTANASEYNTFLVTPSLSYSDVFGEQAENLGTLADNTNDPVFRSQYRQLSIASYDASIAQLEATQSIERAGAAATAALSLASAVAEFNIQRNTRRFMNNSIAWAFGPDSSYYSPVENAPELLLTVIGEYKPGAKGPDKFIYTVNARVSYMGDLIDLPAHRFEMLQYKRKLKKKLGISEIEGYIDLNDSVFPAVHTQLDMGLYTTTYALYAMMIRQVAYDFIAVRKLINDGSWSAGSE